MNELKAVGKYYRLWKESALLHGNSQPYKTVTHKVVAVYVRHFTALRLSLRFFNIYKKVSGKSDWKVNGKRLFGSFQRKLFGSSNRKFCEKVVPFSRTEYSNEYSCSILDTMQLQAFAVVFGKWNWFVQMVNTIPRWNLLVLREFWLPFAQTLDRPVCLFKR